MQINSIDKCCKPKRVNSFKGNHDKDNPSGKMRYKHYEAVSDDILCVRSILKARNDVENSGKMRLFKAIPTISTAIITTGLAIAQPGKLSSKTAAGLGFLAVYSAIDKTAEFVGKLCDKTTKKTQEEPKKDKKSPIKTAAKVAGVALAAAGAAAAIKTGAKTEAFSKAKNFIANETNKLADEINSTRLGKFAEEKINPFIEKHDKLTAAGLLGGFIATRTAEYAAQNILFDGMAVDLAKKANYYYTNDKLVQKAAKEDFDKIDAIEV